MSEEHRGTLHSLPIETLRQRVREAHRLLDQAHALVRASFERNQSPDSGREKQVGALLDALERLLPGIGLLAVQRAGEIGAASGPHGVVVSTPRERSREEIERAELIAGLADAIAQLLWEIERARMSTVMKAADVPSSSQLPQLGVSNRRRS
jgi:hypothetical protein